MSASLLRQEGFLSLDECLAARRAMDVGQAEDAEILAEGIHIQTAIRHAAIIEPAGDLVEAIEERLDACRSHVAASLRVPLGKREGAGFIRYPPGGFYKPHRDRGIDPQWELAARRAVALVLFLNTCRDGGAGDFDGGVLRLFLPDAEVHVRPEAGLLVAFRADTLHEVTEVRGGPRDAVVDWFYDA
jgi:predicted 2-oxoglutarate/Fe(II)-dependent dioxygenase YbiX